MESALLLSHPKVWLTTAPTTESALVFCPGGGQGPSILPFAIVSEEQGQLSFLLQVARERRKRAVFPHQPQHCLV